MEHQLSNGDSTMQFAIAFAAVLAVSSAQFTGFGQPQRYNRPAFPTLPPFPSPSPSPFPSPSPPPRPVINPIVPNRVANSDQTANIIRYENDIGPDGSYAYAFETDNGIGAQAQGTPRVFNSNPPVAPVVSQGSFGWTSPEGQPIAISYIADENGYQPTGDSIPTPPPIPEPILRALEYIARNSQPQQKK